jgi:hypothetical protein
VSLGIYFNVFYSQISLLSLYTLKNIAEETGKKIRSGRTGKCKREKQMGKETERERE